MANVTINMSEKELKKLLKEKGIEYDTISENTEHTLYKEIIENAIEIYEIDKMYKSLFKNKRRKTIKGKVDKLYEDAYNDWQDPVIELMYKADKLILNLLPEE